LEDVHLALSRLNSNQDLTSKRHWIRIKECWLFSSGRKDRGFQTDLPNDGNLKPISYKYIEANCGKRKLKRGRFNEANRLAERMVSEHPSSPIGQDILSFITRNSQSGVQTK